MVIVQLDHFPNVCRLCMQPKPPDQLIPIESSTLEHGNQTLADLLNDLTSVAIPKDVTESVPRAMCCKCFAEFEFVVQYQRKLILLTRFQVAFARLKAGDKAPTEDILCNSRCELESLFKELNICAEGEEIALDRLLEYDPGKPTDLSVLKMENNSSVVENVGKQEESEYYNVEYIEDGEDVSSREKQNEEHQATAESIEAVAEFLQETEEESNMFYFINECEEGPANVAEEIPRPQHLTHSSKNYEFHLAHHKKFEGTPSERKEPPVKRKQKIRMLQCLYCKYRTTSKSMFQNHVDRHANPTDENPWKCSFANCSEAFPTKDDLLKHKKEIHSNYVCDICGLAVKHKYTLEVHLRRHNGNSNYPCWYCDTSFYTANELKMHMTVVHLNSAEFLCNECGLAFKNKKSLTLHERTHSEQRSFSCEECNMTFKTSTLLRRHHNSIHRGIKFYCTMCPVSYGRKDKLRMHMEKIHKVQTYFPCEICLKTFATAFELTEHSEHHRNPKDLECATCLLAFLNAKEFDEHLCISYRDDYYCCDRDFKYHLQYNKHMFLAHGLKTNARVRLTANQLVGAARASRKQIERCTKCEKAFATRKLKKDHMVLCLKDAVGERMEVDAGQRQREVHDVLDVHAEDEAHRMVSFEQGQPVVSHTG
ncbi:hypothetical protein RP20_CCG018468 [Aedes albopictus]|nr:hypothetical protein RP20_CCG018468 [Aedes albopictus]